ncbi:MAG: aminoacyl-tRNA hydrolase [Betaproteobacteria bacterium]|nr:aminoacyl-tRNA hydrolase [Betaproteobacteria bacterium]
MESTVRLIVGLGNPGKEYEPTRHNAGFWFVDRLSEAFHGAWRLESRYQSQLSSIRIEQQDIWLLKPLTYMNESGRAVSLFSQFYRLLPSDILVVHDELDLSAGEVKLKFGGGSAGHNGLKDITRAISTPEYWRLRLGIGHPGERHRVADYVLNRPTQAERVAIDEAMDTAQSIMPEFLIGSKEKAIKQLHSKER